ncbi:MAG: hypothetical protein K6G71_06465 [Clostridiales bacterium]|nr:hypothetical protein [Clostridiales bacterium]
MLPLSTITNIGDLSALFAFFRKASYLLFSLLFSLSGAVSAPTSVSGADMRLENEFEYLYSDGVSFCQGITTDGEYFYGTGCIKYVDYNAIVKIDARTGEIVLRNEMCLPADVLSKGYSHLGDCSYYNGKIYAACEAFFFKDPAVMIFDAESLEFIGYHVLPAEGQGSGHFPWLCVKDGTVYYTQSRDVDEIRMLDADDFSYKGSIPLDRTVTKITGGDILDGTLYLSANTGGSKKITYAVDLETGETTEAFVRETGSVFTEAEGLSIAGSESGTVFYYLDVVFVSKTVIGTYVTRA